MQTKRNTKSNHNSRFSLVDLAVIIFCLCLAVLSFYMFFQNLTKTIVRTDKKSIATVTDKVYSVQRRFIDRAVWDRPQKGSLVYNGDTFHTGSESTMELTLVDESVIRLSQNSMVQVFFSGEKGASINVGSGDISVETKENDIIVNSGESSINVKSNSTVHAQQSDGNNSTFVVESGEAAVISVDGEVSEVLTKDALFESGEKRPLTMLSGFGTTQILNQEGGNTKTKVHFKWNNNFAKDEEIVLETSKSKDFSQVSQKFVVTGKNEALIPQENGTVYWRLYAVKKGAEDSSTVKGKIRILSAPPPKLLMPENNEAFTYHSEKPMIDFIWKGNDVASAYAIEFADNKAMEKPFLKRIVNVESLSLNVFESGTWYWRVIPQYRGGGDRAKMSSVYSFRVEKTETAVPPLTLSPQGAVDTAQGRDLVFAWQHAPEAKRYKLLVADNKELRNPIIEEETHDNTVTIKKAAERLPKGEYYWAVSSIDANGRVLSKSKAQSFSTGTTNVVLHSIFPPEGYTIADALCQDVQFTWNTNVPTAQHFQVSKTKDFSDIVVDRISTSSSMSGLRLDVGEYYWRIMAKTEAKIKTSETKKFAVVDALPAPVLTHTDDHIVIVPKKKNVFEWKPVPGADYYQIKIMKPNGDPQPLYENLFITDTKLTLDLKHIEDGMYPISIQGFASQTLTSTRRYSLKYDKAVSMVHLRPIELEYPKNRSRMNGVRAALNPTSLRWSSVETPHNAVLTLTRRGRRKAILSIKSPEKEVQLPPLVAGTYRWRVVGQTSSGLDISAPRSFTFYVSEIPLLPKAVFTAPNVNQSFGVDYFRSHRNIAFSWKTVDTATHYLIRLCDKKGGLVQKLEKRAPRNGRTVSFTFTKLDRLYRGSFYIEVVAVRKLKSGEVFQQGRKSRRYFNIDLPQVKKLETDETGVLYGN